MLEEVNKTFKNKAGKSIEVFQESLKTIRTGRASAAVFDKVTVEYYGAETPINQVATVTVPEARLILIQPWEKTMLGPIEKAILKSELGFNPSNDGNVIRINIPALTEETRKELVKEAKHIAEQAKISIRAVRKEANDMLKKALKNGDVSEDEEKKGLDDIQSMTDKKMKEITDILESKEKEILEI